MSIKKDELYHNWKFCTLLQMIILFPEDTPFSNVDSLIRHIDLLLNNKTSFVWFNSLINFDIINQMSDSISYDIIINQLFDICHSWFIDNKKKIPPFFQTSLGYDSTSHKRYYILSIDPIFIYCEDSEENDAVIPATIIKKEVPIEDKEILKDSEVTETQENPIKTKSFHIHLKTTYVKQNKTYTSFLLTKSVIPVHFHLCITDYPTFYAYIHDWDNNSNIHIREILASITFIYRYVGVIRPLYIRTSSDRLMEYLREVDYTPFKINSINSFEDLLDQILDYLISSLLSIHFRAPVSQTIEVYYRIITSPMDLSTIKTRISEHFYTLYSAFHNDLMQMFQNCFTFNYTTEPAYIEGALLKLIYMNIYVQLTDFFQSYPEYSCLYLKNTVVPTFKEYSADKDMNTFLNTDSNLDIQYPVIITEMNKENLNHYTSLPQELRGYIYVNERLYIKEDYLAQDKTCLSVSESDIVYNTGKYDITGEFIFVIKGNKAGYIPKTITQKDHPTMNLYKTKRLKENTIEILEEGIVTTDHIESLKY